MSRSQREKPPILKIIGQRPSFDPGIVFLLVFLDQASKYLAQISLSTERSFVLVPSVVSLTLHANTGAAFGLFQNSARILTGLSLSFVGVMCAYLFTRKERTHYHAPFHWILAGATGNLIDRLRWGYVVDFIDFGFWPIFNMADSLITLGALALIVITLQKR